MAFKNLASYTDELISELFRKYGAFWAFSKSQFDEAKKENIIYNVCLGNCYCDKNTIKNFLTEMQEIYKNGKILFLKENNSYDIIKYELANYECFYTHDLEDAFCVLADYGFSYEQVLEVFHKELPKYD